MAANIKSKEKATRKILEIMSCRIIFKSFDSDKSEVRKISKPLLSYIMQQLYQEQIEFVGSFSDGFYSICTYDSGDIDALRLSKYCFRSEDELLFEYKTNDPCFLQIPLTKKLKQMGVVPVNDKYLSAALVRWPFSPIFEYFRVYSHGEEIPYNIFYQILPIDSEMKKCALNLSKPYIQDTKEISNNSSLSTINVKQLHLWSIVHIVLAYLLASCNKESLSFLREILFGENTESISALENLCKLSLEVMRLQNTLAEFKLFDLAYFSSSGFDKLMKEAIAEETIMVDHALPLNKISFDLVAAIPCEGWPRTAKNFLKRSRKWPSYDIVNKIVECGYQVVPKSPDLNPNEVLDFILSFSPAEKMLAQHIPEKVQDAYRIVKLCYKTTGCRDNGIKRALKTFHLKTALFWVTEQTEPSEWDKEDMFWCVQHIVEYIIKCLVEKFLPSFFVDKANLLNGFSDCDFAHMIQVFLCLSENLAGYINLALNRDLYHLQLIWCEEDFVNLKTSVLFDSNPWMERTKQNKTKMHEEKVHNPYTFFEKHANDALSSNPDNMRVSHNITQDQLEFAEIFVHTIQALDMDLYHFIFKDVEPCFTLSIFNLVKPAILAEYPNFDQKSEKEFGEKLLKCLKEGINDYGFFFKAMCDKIRGVISPSTINNDALYIAEFLKAFRQQPNISEGDVEDLLINLIFFCHFTKLRYFWMGPGHQILRCIREFLQDCKYLMTILFNVKTIFPIPLMMPEKLKILLGGIQPKCTMPPLIRKT